MFNIVLVQPEIPPNTGNVIRLAANTGCRLHLIEPLGFSMDDKLLRRAGLDYHEYAELRRYACWAELLQEHAPPPERCYAYTTRASRPFGQAQFAAGDWLVFGNETAGLPEALRESFAPDVAVAGRHLVHAAAVDGEFARGDGLQARDHPQERGLAAAGGADKDDELAVGDVEVDARQDLGAAVGLGDPGKAHGGHGISP